MLTMNAHQKREFFLNFPRQTASELRLLWELMKDPDRYMTAPLLEDMLKIIIAASESSEEEVKFFFAEVFEQKHPRAVTLFFRNSDYKDRIPCFDSRSNDKFLPRGVKVCGWISNEGGMVETPAVMTVAQSSNFRDVLQEALLHFNWDVIPEQLVAEKLICFR